MLDHLITCASEKYKLHAFALIDSFHVLYPNATCTIIHFGENFSRINRKNVEYVEVPKAVNFAWDPTHFFFKAFAYYYAMSVVSKPFIYLDSRHRFLSKPDLIDLSLEKYSRFLVPYTNSKIFNNGLHTTSTAINKILSLHHNYNSHTIDSLKNCMHYWAAIHAWIPTPDNIKFINEVYRLMHDVEIAGPSNRLSFDRNITGYADHRNDQSVFSSLIHLMNLDNYLTTELSTRIISEYGDIDTIRILDREYVINDNRKIKGRIDYV